MQKIQWRHSWTVTPKSPWHLPFSGPWGELLLRPATFCSASLYMARTEKDPISSATAARLVFLLQPREVVWSISHQTGNPFIKSYLGSQGHNFNKTLKKWSASSRFWAHLSVIFSESRNLFSIFYPLDVQYISKKKNACFCSRQMLFSRTLRI